MSKKAFIIGISNYLNSDFYLKNPINDAKAMAEILEYKNFSIDLHLDTTLKELRDSFKIFVEKMNDGDTILFFYAGHGIEYRDVNYILHSDLKNLNEENPLSLDEIQNCFNVKNSSGIKMIILDACRKDDGFEGKTLKKIKSNRNTLIAFSTSPGNVAKDGNKDLSRYTKNLISSIQEYDLTINEVFKKTRELLISETEFTQIPWEHSSITDEFSFDTIKVPKLVKIFRSIEKVYSIKYFKDKNGFMVGGDNKFLSFYSPEFDVIELETSLESISEIDITEKSMVIVGERRLCFWKEKERSIQDFDFNCHTVSINKDNYIFVAGESNLGILFNPIDNIFKEFDLKKELEEEFNLVPISEDRDSLEAFKSNAYRLKSFPDELSIYCSEFNLMDDNIIAFGGANYLFAIKNLEDDTYLYFNDDKELFHMTYSIKFSLDGKYIVTAHDKGKAILWDAKTFEIKNIFQINEYIEKTEYFEFSEERISNSIHHVEFSPDSKVMVFGTSESKLIFWDVQYKTKIGEISLSIEALSVYSFTYSADGTEFIVSIDKDKKIYFFKT